MSACFTRGFINFNPRSPRGERRILASFAGYASTFQSTLPARGATGLSLSLVALVLNFNPRSPRGERLRKTIDISDISGISIHAPREGSDIFYKFMMTLIGNFNPRSPRGERHLCIMLIDSLSHFNPRSPRGERQQYCTDIHDPNGNIATRLPNEACLRDEKHRFEPKKVI